MARIWILRASSKVKGYSVTKDAYAKNGSHHITGYLFDVNGNQHGRSADFYSEYSANIAMLTTVGGDNWEYLEDVDDSDAAAKIASIVSEAH